MLKYLLLQPPGSCRIFTRSSSLYPPLGLCQLAACVPRSDCRVFDAEALNLSLEETISNVCASKPMCVGFTVTTMTMKLIETYARAIKERLPHTICIAGGPQATAAPERVMNVCPSLDFVFRGEGEVAFPSMVRAIENSAIGGVEDEHKRNLNNLAKIPGLVSRTETNPRKNVEIQRLTEEDFTSNYNGTQEPLPFPDFSSLYPLESYWCPDAKRRPMLTFMTARGCPFRCAFCATPNTIGRNVRGWDPRLVAAELERLSKLGVREISFVDDLFVAKPSRVRQLCNEMISREIDLTWFANTRADRVNPELCGLMKKAGCHQVFMGVESGSPKLLKYMKKDETAETMVRGAEVLRQAGIEISCGFIIGLPGETDETVSETIQLAHQLRPNRIQFSRWTPLAGSALVDSPSSFDVNPLSAPALENWSGLGALDAGLLNGAGGFHGAKLSATENKLKDRVDMWIARCYEECRAKRTGEVSWGAASI